MIGDIRALFPGLKDTIYLNTATMSVGCAPAVEAYERAVACDPVSAFGGIIAVNRRLDRAAAEAIAGQFVEVLIAPDYDAGALDVMTERPNARKPSVRS